VLVLSAGQLVEQGSLSEVFGRPRDAYTKALLSAVPPLPPQAAVEEAPN
jgi:peptide/nickel transport system ATP-binding protein